METLKLAPQDVEEDEDDEINQSAQKTISFPIEIIEDILSRLPVKTLLQFRSVSKQWFSLISDNPYFRKLHFNRSRVRKSFFIPAYDILTKQRHFLSAPHHGGPVTHLITRRDAGIHDDMLRCDTTEAEHLNGLILFTSRNPPFVENYAFVVNPATRKVFKVPPPPPPFKYSLYFFGFDESNNEHKILSTCCSLDYKTIEFMIFSLSTYSWRQISVDLEGFPSLLEIINYIENSVCVKSVIHLMLCDSWKILAFDLTTEKVSVIQIPQGAIPCEFASRYTKAMFEKDVLFLVKDKGLLGVVCHDHVVETKELNIWILQDYVNRVWVRETVRLPECFELVRFEVMGYHGMENLLFSCPMFCSEMVHTLILDMKTESFEFLNFNLGYPFLSLRTVKFSQFSSYVESIFPLREE